MPYHVNTFLYYPTALQSGHVFFIPGIHVSQHVRWKHFIFKYYAGLSKHILHKFLSISDVVLDWIGYILV